MLKYVKKLCDPAYFYFCISLITLIVLSLQNLGSVKTYCVGQYNCPVENVGLVFASKSVYILFWTYILNKLCSSGYKSLSWFLVLFPYVLMFVLILLLMVTQNQM